MSDILRNIPEQIESERRDPPRPNAGRWPRRARRLEGALRDTAQHALAN